MPDSADRISEAKFILAALGLPPGQQNERTALTLLALADLAPANSWDQTKRPLRRIHDIIVFMREAYGKHYAENSRETIRRQSVHQMEQARIVDRNPDDPSRPTNSGKTVYALSFEAMKVLHGFGGAGFQSLVDDFRARHGQLQSAYKQMRKLHQIPVTLADGELVLLSPGDHNRLQAAVIAEFGPRFAPGGVLLYLGDAENRFAVHESERLADLGLSDLDGKLPDLIIHLEPRNWLVLVEAVTSHGPISPKRLVELKELFAPCAAGLVFVTAFDTLARFRSFAADIAWETEVWVAETPEHMIHFDGERFLGPYGAPSAQV